jgi:hypothetical protein
MKGLDETGGASAQDEGEVGDVERAGETTAAAAVSGPAHDKPVGADTMVKVADAPTPERVKDSDSA